MVRLNRVNKKENKKENKPRCYHLSSRLLIRDGSRLHETSSPNSDVETSPSLLWMTAVPLPLRDRRALTRTADRRTVSAQGRTSKLVSESVSPIYRRQNLSDHARLPVHLYCVPPGHVSLKSYSNYAHHQRYTADSRQEYKEASCAQSTLRTNNNKTLSYYIVTRYNHHRKITDPTNRMGLSYISSQFLSKCSRHFSPPKIKNSRIIVLVRCASI